MAGALSTRAAMTALILLAVLAQSEPSAPPDAVAPEAPLPEPAEVEDLAEHTPKEGPGARFGVVSIAAGTVSIGIRTAPVDPLTAPRLTAQATGFSGIAGMGLRYGLKPREDERMLMPAISVIAGSMFQLDNFSPFLEARAELMSVTPGGPLQPNFLVYGTSGLSTTPLGHRSSFSVAPHFGLGLGWNWIPRGGGGGVGGGWGGLGGGGWGSGGAGLLIGLPVALAIAAMIFAGRVEVRYTARPLTGPGSDFVAVMIGFGT
jgi:hypothetical protein